MGSRSRRHELRILPPMLARRHLLALAAFLAFSLMPVFTRGAHAPVVAIAAWRAVFVALVFGGWAMAAEGGPRALRPTPTTLKLGVLYGLALALASSTFVAGYALTTAATTIFLHNLAPVAAFPLAWWAFRERPTASAMTGAMIAVVGVALLSGVSLLQFGRMTNPRFLLGDLAALVSAVGYAAVLVCTRATRREDTPILGTLFVAWCVAAAVLVLVALPLEGLAMPPSAWLWVLGLAVVSTNLPFWLLNLSMKDLSAGLASVLSMSEVVFVTLIGVGLYGEHLAPIGWLGGGLVVLGLLYPLALPGDDPSPTDPIGTLPPETLTRRWLRLALCLVLLNSGAALALWGSAPGGALLAWGGLVGVLRLGHAPSSDLLEGRFTLALRWGFAALAAVALGGLALKSGWARPGASGAVAGLALAALWADRGLAGGEAERDRDLRPLASLAFGLLAAGQLLGILGHAASVALNAAAAAALALEAWGVFLAAVRDRLHGTQVHQTPEQAPLDALPRRLAAPRRWVPLAALVVLSGGVAVVPPGHPAVVERLGEPLAAVASPGLLVRLPPPLERIRPIDVDSVRTLELATPDAALLCGDQSMVAIEAVLEYSVARARQALYSATEPETALAGLGRAALVAALSRRSQEEVLTTGRRELEAEVQRLAQAGVDRVGLGLEVEAVHLLTVSVPSPVLAAFLDVISAHEERARSINEAEAYAASVLPLARGEALARIEVAQGGVASLEARAAADVTLFDALLRGGDTAPELTRQRLELEYQEASLAPNQLVVADPRVRIWIEDHAPLPSPGGSP